MARRVFYSFHYVPDNWRAAQIRNIGAIEGNRPATDNDWESIKASGDAAIERWIAAQMRGKSVVLVLIGSGTAGRKWINYEIKRGWQEGKGLLGIHVHRLLDGTRRPSPQGRNPFAKFNIGGVSLDRIVHAYNPPYTDSRDVYRYIANNIAGWFDEAVRIRDKYE